MGLLHCDNVWKNHLLDHVFVASLTYKN